MTRIFVSFLLTFAIVTGVYGQSKFSDLPEQTAPANNSIVPVQQTGGGATEHSTLQNVSKGLDAGLIPNTPAGAISATNVQGAIDELDSEKAGSSHTHVQVDVTDLDHQATSVQGSTTLPGTCTVQEVYVDTDATPAGEQLYLCTATNVWTKVGDGTGGSSNVPSHVYEFFVDYSLAGDDVANRIYNDLPTALTAAGVASGGSAYTRSVVKLAPFDSGTAGLELSLSATVVVPDGVTLMGWEGGIMSHDVNNSTGEVTLFYPTPTANPIVELQGESGLEGIAFLVTSMPANTPLIKITGGNAFIKNVQGKILSSAGADFSVVEIAATASSVTIEDSQLFLPSSGSGGRCINHLDNGFATLRKSWCFDNGNAAHTLFRNGSTGTLTLEFVKIGRAQDVTASTVINNTSTGNVYYNNIAAIDASRIVNASTGLVRNLTNTDNPITLSVCPVGCRFKDPKTAVDFANALSSVDWIIEVYPSTYTVNAFTINSNIHLVGKSTGLGQDTTDDVNITMTTGAHPANGFVTCDGCAMRNLVLNNQTGTTAAAATSTLYTLGTATIENVALWGESGLGQTAAALHVSAGVTYAKNITSVMLAYDSDLRVFRATGAGVLSLRDSWAIRSSGTTAARIVSIEGTSTTNNLFFNRFLANDGTSQATADIFVDTSATLGINNTPYKTKTINGTLNQIDLFAQDAPGLVPGPTATDITEDGFVDAGGDWREVLATDMADADHGDFTYSSNVATLDDDVVAPAEMADADHGDFSYSAGVATLDDDVVAPAEMADADHGDFTYSAGVASLDDDVVAPAEMADADHGDFTYSAGVATLDANVVDSAEIATNAVGTDEIDLNMSPVWIGEHDFGGAVLEIPNSITLPASCDVGDLYADTDATSGQRLYLCESANNWVLQGGAGGDSVSVDGVGVVDPDFVSTGDIDFVDTSNTVSANINASTIVVGDVADGDWGDFSIATNVASLDANTVDSGEIVAGAVDPAHLADADFGDMTVSSGVATLDANVVDSAEIATDAVGTDEIDLTIGPVWTGDHDFGGGGIEIENNTALPGSCTVGQIFMDTDATSGQQLYGCEGGTFVLQGGGGGSSVAATDENGTELSTGITRITAGVGLAMTEPTADEITLSLDGSKAGSQTIYTPVLIQTTTPTGTSTSLTGWSGAGYDYIEIHWRARADTSAVESTGLAIEIDGDTTATNYWRQDQQALDGAGSTSQANDNVLGVMTAASAPTNSFATGVIRVDDPDGTGLHVIYNHHTSYESTNDTVRIGSRSVGYNTTGDIDTIVLKDSAGGNFVTGTKFRVLGFKEATVANPQLGISAETSYTPTHNISAGVGTATGGYRLVGEYVEGWFQIPVTGTITVTGGVLKVGPPSAYPIDGTGINDGARPIGLTQIRDNDTSLTTSGQIRYFSGDSGDMRPGIGFDDWTDKDSAGNDNDEGITEINVNEGIPIAFANGDTIGGTFRYKTTGVAINAALLTDWIDCTFAGVSFTTNTTTTCKYKDVDGERCYQAKISTSGAPAAGATLTIDLPSGDTWDTAQLVDTTGLKNLGQANFYDGATTYPGQIDYNDTNTVQFFAQTASGTYLTRTAASLTVPFTFDASDEVVGQFCGPLTQ